jgi:hypothetical protein
MAATVKSLQEAANAAHYRGDHARVMALCRQILELYPGTVEASDASYYLATGQRRAPRRADPPESNGAAKRNPG